MVHEVVAGVLHEVVTVVGVVCDSQAIRVIPATKTVANTGHTATVAKVPSDFVYIA